ncbi:hypothetical protein A3731_40520 [Roseovarius sp. HI0049]|nr:hypothetical protein A3731_40520 [Roseovarius sp. HI0049]
MIVDVRIKRNRDASYQYSTYPYIQRRLDDYVYRVEHKSFKKLLYPNGFNAEGSVDKVIKSTLENRIAETKLRDLKVIAKNSEAYKSLSPEQLAEKSVQLTFKIGQQRLPTEDDRGILIGAISVGFEKPDLLWGGMHIGVNIAPEPFIYSQRLNNRTSLDRSIDFLSLQLAEYLYFLQYIAR